MKKRGFTKGLDSDLKLGTRGLKVSLYFLILIFLLLLIFLYIRYESAAQIKEIIFDFSLGVSDYLAIFAGVIMFIAVPFLLGIRLGWGIHKN